MMIQAEQIEIDKIIIGERARHDFGDIDELADSISEIGLLQPILVSMGTGDPLLLDGHRRILAYKKLGLKSIAAVIFDPYDTKTYGVSKYLQAEHDANVVRKDFTPSEKVWIADKIKHWIETNKRFEKDNETELKDERGNLPCNEYPKTELLKWTKEHYNKDVKLENREYERTRDKVADAVGMSYKTLQKAKVVVEAAQENPENADLVQKMDQTGKVNPVYKELQNRRNGNLPSGKSAGIDNLPEGSKIVSLIVKMPDGRQKKMGSISNEWFQNKNVLNWIIENVGLGVDEKDIIIHREGNIVKVFDSTNVEGLRQGVSYLVSKYSIQDELIEGVKKDNENLSDSKK